MERKQKRLEIASQEKSEYTMKNAGDVVKALYKTENAVLDAELNRLTHTLNALKAEAAIFLAAKSSDDEWRKLAETAFDADGLTRLLVDLLIDKVYVYPGNRIEIAWKVADFMKAKKGSVMSAQKE